MTKAQLDKRAPWPKQDISKISKVFIRVCCLHFVLFRTLISLIAVKSSSPISEAATAEIVRIQLENRCAYAKRVNLPEDVDNHGEVSVNDHRGVSTDDDGEASANGNGEEDMEG